ncbi:MAG: RIP metalloprotease RseP [Candidatus Moranbacteria bacterium]|nr:RIP metalloprotease RseP [Candidatus Moranbacteria bacterium]
MTFFTIVLFFLLLGLLVFVHELGHFLTAIRNGIAADEFGFGFPPRLAGMYKDKATGKWKFVAGNADVHPDTTIFSLNWIPFGGFVRIRGEDQNASIEPDSFAGKSAWIRVKVLGAGVFMNFVLAWVLLSTVLMLGFPQPITNENRERAGKADIQILGVAKESPAERMGIRPGDHVLSVDGKTVRTLEEAKSAIDEKRGSEIALGIDRFGEELTLRGTPRKATPEGEGALGVSFAETAVISYPWYEAPVRGAQATYNTTTAILSALGGIVKNIFVGEKAGVDVTGPVGIVVMTKQMSDLGIPYLLQFAAILSINLGIFNILPFPGLDGGRILFILIEKIKGSPVKETVEQWSHTVGFLLLLLLMVLVTIKDVSQFKLLEKIGNLF